MQVDLQRHRVAGPFLFFFDRLIEQFGFGVVSAISRVPCRSVLASLGLSGEAKGRYICLGGRWIYCYSFDEELQQFGVTLVTGRRARRREDEKDRCYIAKGLLDDVQFGCGKGGVVA